MAEDTIKEEVQSWFNRITKAEQEREKRKPGIIENYISIYGDDWMQYDQKDGTDYKRLNLSDDDVESYRFDWILSTLKVWIASLNLRNAEIMLTPKKHINYNRQNAQEKVKRTEAFLNAVNADSPGIEIERIVTTVDGHAAMGITKTFYVPHYIDNPKAGQPKTGQNGLPLFDEIGVFILEPDRIRDSGSFKEKRIDPLKFIIGLPCDHNLDEAPFLGEEINTTLEHLKRKDNIYDQTVVRKLREKLNVDSDKKDWEVDVTIYELYDLFNNKLFALCDQYMDDYIRKPIKVPTGIEGHPYTFLIFNHIGGQAYPKPEISSLLDMQRDYNQGRRWMKDAAETSRNVVGIKGEVDTKRLFDGSSRWVKLEGGASVNVLNKDAPTEKPLVEHMQSCERDFNQTARQSEQARGQTGTANFAIEVEKAAMSEAEGATDKIEVVKKWRAEVEEKKLKLMVANLQSDFSYDTDFQIPFTRTDLDVDVDINIDIVRKTEKSRAIEKKQDIDLLGVYPELRFTEKFMNKVFNDFEVSGINEIIKELQDVITAQQEAQKEGAKTSISMSMPVALDWGTMNEENRNIIQQALFQMIMASLPQQSKEGQPENGGGTRTGESAAAGTEGLQGPVGE